jgi:hypothetical protein
MWKDTIKAEIKDILTNSPVIYKYVGCSKIVLKILKESKLQLSSPKNFNDPFDCYEKLITFEKISAADLERLTKKYANQFPDAIKKIEIGLKKSNFGEISEAYKKYGISNFISTVGITCFSRNYKHNLMWSHYGESHSGICLGFDLIELYSSLEKVPNSDKSLLKVNYESVFESKDFFQDGLSSIIHWLKTKSIYWIYEDEIRLLYTKLKLNDSGKKFIKISQKSFSEIIFGVNFPFDQNSELLDYISTNYPKIDLYKMQPTKNSFEIDRVKITLKN